MTLAEKLGNISSAQNADIDVAINFVNAQVRAYFLECPAFEEHLIRDLSDSEKESRKKSITVTCWKSSDDVVLIRVAGFSLSISKSIAPTDFARLSSYASLLKLAMRLIGTVAQCLRQEGFCVSGPRETLRCPDSVANSITISW